MLCTDSGQKPAKVVASVGGVYPLAQLTGTSTNGAYNCLQEQQRFWEELHLEKGATILPLFNIPHSFLDIKICCCEVLASLLTPMSYEKIHLYIKTPLEAPVLPWRYIVGNWKKSFTVNHLSSTYPELVLALMVVCDASVTKVGGL